MKYVWDCLHRAGLAWEQYDRFDSIIHQRWEQDPPASLEDVRGELRLGPESIQRVKGELASVIVPAAVENPALAAELESCETAMLDLADGAGHAAFGAGEQLPRWPALAGRVGG